MSEQQAAGFLPLIDIFMINDEVEMMRTRLALHAPVTRRFIILESNVTFSGRSKPLHARLNLTADECEQYNVVVLNVELSSSQRYNAQRVVSRTAGKSVEWARELGQRAYVNRLVEEQVLATAREGDALVHMSDVDELLDPRVVRRARVDKCVSPYLRNYVYSEYCTNGVPPWHRSVLFRAGSGWFEKALRDRCPWSRSVALEAFQMRMASDETCPPTTSFVGWHFGNFMSSPAIVNKLKSFSHTTETFVRAIINSNDSVGEIQHRAKNCVDVRGRTGRKAWPPYDGVLPELDHWPRNENAIAADHWSTTQLQDFARTMHSEIRQTREKLSALALRRQNATRTMDNEPPRAAWQEVPVVVDVLREAAMPAARRNHSVLPRPIEPPSPPGWRLDAVILETAMELHNMRSKLNLTLTALSARATSTRSDLKDEGPVKGVRFVGEEDVQ